MSNIPWAYSTNEFDELWKDQAETVPDILTTMFAQQHEHMRAYASIAPGAQLPPYLWGDLDNPRTQAAIREFASYTVEELYEAINHLKNKPWKQTFKKTDVEAFKEELADMWHFLIEMHILAGMSPLDVFRAYFKKSLINEQRQQGGY